MKGWAIAVLVVAVALLGVLAFLFAQGAPTAPTAQLYTPIQPGSAQGLLVQVQFGFYSIVAPNSIWTPGIHLVYSAVERASSGTPTVLVSNGTAAPNIVSSSRQFYIVSTTLLINTVASCSGIGCTGISENLTVTAQASVVTPYLAWFSPVTVAVFSSTQAGCNSGTPCQSISNPGGPVPAPTAASQNSFYLELFVPLTALVAVVSLGAGLILTKHPVVWGVTGIAVVLILVEFLIW